MKIENIQDRLKNIIPFIKTGNVLNSNILHYNTGWNVFLKEVRQTVPRAVIQDRGETIFIGKMSPGCICCKEGKWDCIFITFSCNLNCDFCLSPNSNKKKAPFSALGNRWEDILGRYHKLRIKGVSFTGGEPFLKFERLKVWFHKIKNAFPDNYFWIYTNGLVLKTEYINCLADMGLNELRFNLAATNYVNKNVLKKMEYASKKIKRITVEIPAITTHKKKLLSSIDIWSRAGVQFLNLHELIREQNSNSANLSGNFYSLVLKDGHKTDISEDSKYLILEVIKTLIYKKIPLNVNVCSLKNKFRQIRGRRNNFAKLCKEDYEKQLDYEHLETIFAFKDNNHFFFIHPDVFIQKRDEYKKFQFFRLVRFAPLSIFNKTRYNIVEQI